MGRGEDILVLVRGRYPCNSKYSKVPVPFDETGKLGLEGGKLAPLALAVLP